MVLEELGTADLEDATARAPSQIVWGGGFDMVIGISPLLIP